LNLRILWPVLGALVWLGGCRALPPAPPPAALVSGEEVLSRLQSRQQNLRALAAKGSLAFLSAEKNYAGTAIITGQFPATLKLEILDAILGRTRLAFASNGAEVRVLFPGEAKLFYGPATPRNLAAVLPPTVTLPQALRLLVGALPLSQGPPDRFTYDAAQGLYRLEWGPAAGPLQERLWVTAQGLYPVKEEWFGAAPEPRFTAELADFGAQAPDLPGKLILKTNAPKIELRLAYKELKLNPVLTAADLTLSTPAGVAQVPLAP
jgi:hypothetical protein